MLSTGALSFQGKEIVVDLYGPVKLVYRVESQEKVVAWLQSKDQGFDLRECEFLSAGPPHWFIKGRSLKLIQPDTQFSLLKKAMGEELRLADLEDEEVPVEYLGNAREAIKIQNEPQPMLKLTDRTGAFANLWLDYGQDSIDFHNPAVSVGGQKRQREVEKGWQKDLLETDFILKQAGTSHYYCPMDKVASSLTFLLELGWKIFDLQGRRIVRQSDVDFQFHEEKGEVRIRGKVRYADHVMNLQEVVGSFNRRERFIQLSSNEVGLISDETAKPFAEECEAVEDGFRAPLSRALSFGDLLERHGEPSLKELVGKLGDFQGLTQAVPGENFGATLRPYQQTGVNWLSFLYENGFHGLLADEMGLGKTVQVIGFLSRLKLSDPVLIVMPTTLLFNWKREFEQFLPEAKVAIYHGKERQMASAQVILTSYATLRLDLDIFRKQKFHAVILDEAQVIKNAHTQVSTAVCQLQAQFRLCLSGTPIENNGMELWSYFRFLMPDLLGDEEAFRGDNAAADFDARYLQKIKRKIRPFLLRRLKGEVAKDLPEKIEQIVYVEMTPEQRALYEQFLQGSKVLQKVKSDGAAKHRMEIFETILRLRQICCTPLLCSSLFPEETLFSSAKMEIVLQDLETLVAEGHKVLVYSQFTSLLQLFVKEAKARSWLYAYLDGSTKNREEEVVKFQQQENLSLFFISLKAGGVGLNLTAADYVYILDPWWNEAVENQAINRAHRIGRKDSVIAKRFITLESVEEKMLKLKERKRQIAENFLDEEGLMEQLSLQDLTDLLN